MERLVKKVETGYSYVYECLECGSIHDIWVNAPDPFPTPEFIYCERCHHREPMEIRQIQEITKEAWREIAEMHSLMQNTIKSFRAIKEKVEKVAIEHNRIAYDSTMLELERDILRATVSQIEEIVETKSEKKYEFVKDTIKNGIQDCKKLGLQDVVKKINQNLNN